MAEVRVNLYEGLFLLSSDASANLQTGIDFLTEVFHRAEAEVIVLRKWDERKLAYAIRQQKRGVYVLAIFKARSTQIANIERDCNLSEIVTRCLIIKGDHLGETEIELAKRDVPIQAEARMRDVGEAKPDARTAPPDGQAASADDTADAPAEAGEA